MLSGISKVSYCCKSMCKHLMSHDIISYSDPNFTELVMYMYWI